MNSHSKLFFFLCTVLILVRISIAQQQEVPGFIYRYCVPNGNFTDNSTYQINLQTLLSDISSNTQIDYGFYNSSFGLNSDRVNAIALCRGDVSLDTCRSCIKNSTKRLTQICPYNKEAYGWYDECMLRYTNRSNIFGTREDIPKIHYCNVNNAWNNKDQFNEALGNLMSDLRNKAASGDSRRKFSTGNVIAGGFENIYGLVQCTPDLSELDCASCLNWTISQTPILCDKKQGGRYITPSCNIRYETHQFYEFNGTASSPPPTSTNTTTTKGSKSNTSRTVIIIAVSIVTSIIVIVCICIYLIRVRNPKKKEFYEAVESLQFDFETIRVATDNFSDANKLGQGGFGAVYKGRLSNGQDIAVKRLSKDSRQGDLEFKNEVMLVAKLQHRNLVKLLGFCLERNERLLVYEFVAKASLDHYIFGINRASLDWETRYKIIGGIARGLLYLHEDSRLRIIHRDLKAGNILLDEEMNPKIADFGTARLFEMDQTQGCTNRIMGTKGYMAPEYASDGQFSVKSDVFSFGVLVLEIVSGQRNTSFRNGEDDVENLISYAWRSWREGTVSNMVDSTLRSGSGTEIMRCIHIGLLCVQKSISDRPTMASVHLKLNSYSTNLPVPSQPGFFMNSNSSAENISAHFSVNDVSITELDPR